MDEGFTWRGLEKGQDAAVHQGTEKRAERTQGPQDV